MNAHMVELAFAARTDTGRVRKRNEDAVAVSERHSVAILADGMGGYKAGDVASKMAVSTMMKSIESHLETLVDAHRSPGRQLRNLLIDAANEANRSIHDEAHHNLQCSGMGTTVVATVFHHDKVVVAHAGDSRLYRWRDHALVHLTHDHSLMQQQIDAGLMTVDEARSSPVRNLITRALGVEERVEVEVHEHATLQGDVYLLCSDGLSDMLSDGDIAGILEHCGDNIASACDTLIWQANANGGYDNVSVILVAVRSVRAERQLPLVGRLLNWLR
jgi:protein phosphatase